MRRLWVGLGLLALLFGMIVLWVRDRSSANPATVVASSLQSLHEQNRLSAFAARFVTMVSSSQGQFGLSAEKTLIMPAMVRYEIDLAKLNQDDLRWDAANRILRITLPPIEISSPEFDLAAAKEYKAGSILLTLTDAERVLDQANRIKAQADVLTQARAEPMLRLARDAHARALTRSFAMPLAAAGIEAKVEVETKK